MGRPTRRCGNACTSFGGTSGNGGGQKGGWGKLEHKNGTS